MTAQSFIKKRPYLIWHTKDLKHLSDDAIVESVLNYGDFNDVKKLISIFGSRKTAKIFYKHVKRARRNYDSKIERYFKLFFRKYR